MIVYQLVLEFTILYFITRRSIQNLFTGLRLIFRHNGTVYTLMAVLFFPGTVVHELAHAVMARALWLKVTHINLFPTRAHNTLKLGSIEYIKRDFLRGVLVGVAPILAGLLILWLIAYFSQH